MDLSDREKEELVNNLNKLTLRVFLPHAPKFIVTEEMCNEAKRRCEIKDKLYGSSHIVENDERRSVGDIGELVFYQYRYGDWRKIPDPVYEEGGDIDFRIGKLTGDVKASEPEYLVDYTANFVFMVPSLSRDIYVYICIYEGFAYILGFAMKSEFENKRMYYHNLHPIEDLSTKPIRLDRKIKGQLSLEDQARFSHSLMKYNIEDFQKLLEKMIVKASTGQ